MSANISCMAEFNIDMMLKRLDIYADDCVVKSSLKMLMNIFYADREFHSDPGRNARAVKGHIEDRVVPRLMLFDRYEADLFPREESRNAAVFALICHPVLDRIYSCIENDEDERQHIYSIFGEDLFMMGYCIHDEMQTRKENSQPRNFIFNESLHLSQIDAMADIEDFQSHIDELCDDILVDVWKTDFPRWNAMTFAEFEISYDLKSELSILRALIQDELGTRITLTRAPSPANNI